MRSTVIVSTLAALALTSLPMNGRAASDKRESGSAIVIVFKDGHRQAFNLADISRVEFTGSGAVPGVSSNPDWPARGRYIGKWAVGDGQGSTFIINLKEDGSAFRSRGSIHGTWTYVNGDALVTWDDGWKDAIRHAGSGFEKYAYGDGKSFNDDPDNVTSARNTTPRPI